MVKDPSHTNSNPFQNLAICKASTLSFNPNYFWTFVVTMEFLNSFGFRMISMRVIFCQSFRLTDFTVYAWRLFKDSWGRSGLNWLINRSWRCLSISPSYTGSVSQTLTQNCIEFFFIAKPALFHQQELFLCTLEVAARYAGLLLAPTGIFFMSVLAQILVIFGDQ